MTGPAYSQRVNHQISWEKNDMLGRKFLLDTETCRTYQLGKIKPS